MKKFLIRLLLFFVLVLAIDVVAGKGFAYMVAHAKGGDNGRNNYICNEIKTDVLVFGSSRAIHHFNPAIIEDSLGMSCYNCGQNGNGVILNYARFQLICHRYTPKLIVYDVTSGFDLLAGDDNHKYLGWLKAYYDKPGIADVFESVDSTEKYKMLCQMYRYNTKFIQVISDYIHPLQDDAYAGFRPLKGEMDAMKVSKPVIKDHYDFDPLKIAYMKKFVELAKANNIELVFTVSPMWAGMDAAQLSPLKEICHQNGIRLLDYSSDTNYLHNNTLFKDGAHLNSRGADQFSKDFVMDYVVTQSPENQ